MRQAAKVGAEGVECVTWEGSERSAGQCPREYHQEDGESRKKIYGRFRMYIAEGRHVQDYCETMKALQVAATSYVGSRPLREARPLPSHLAALS